MKFKHFNIGIVSRLLIIVLFSFVGGYLIFEQKNYSLFILVFILIIIALINLVRYFNKINKWISFFLSGIENEDTSLRIPSSTGNKAIDDIFEGMKKLNELFKQTKIDITSQEQYFKTVINQSATGLFSVNEKGRVININPSAVKLTDIQEYHHVNSLSKINKSLPDFILNKSQNSTLQSTIFENKYGQKLLFKLSQLKTAKETIVLIAVSDITKELDNREVDAWVKLARTLSHEIMNNIAPVTSLSQVISGYFIKNNKVINAKDINDKVISNTVKGLNVIEERSTALMNFVENYRKFTKLPEPDIKKVNISEIIENCLIAVSAFQKFDHITTEKNIPENIYFFTDEKLLSQVIINVLKNAYEVLIEQNTSNSILKIDLIKNEHSIQIEISNNGSEILPELREQIFIPFFTTKENGTGIGLSLSKQILLQMNGDIVLKPENNSFTTFVVVLSNSR